MIHAFLNDGSNSWSLERQKREDEEMKTIHDWEVAASNGE